MGEEDFAAEVARVFVRWAFDSRTAPGYPNLALSAGLTIAFVDHGLQHVLEKASPHRGDNG